MSGHNFFILSNALPLSLNRNCMKLMKCVLIGRISGLSSLLYITKCVRSSRMFLNCMLQLLRDNTDNNTILLTQEFHKDLHWFNVFLLSYNGVTMYHVTP